MDGKHVLQVALIAAVTVAIAMRIQAVRDIVAPSLPALPKA
jgi:hypothetical protein